MYNSPADESEKRLLPLPNGSDEETVRHVEFQSFRSRRALQLWTIFNAVLSLMVLSAALFQVRPQSSLLNESLQRISSYSPILASVEVPTFTSTVDGGIAANVKHSIARLPPGPEADAAWKRFEEVRTVVISKADVIAMGKDPETAAQFPNEHWGFGEDAYMGQLDVVHQLHCLNQLRKQAFASYHEPNVDQHPEWQWIHLQHCVSILLENLMCHADTELLTMNWIREVEYPFPDFSINKQCRDFETLLAWQAERAVDMDQWLNMSKPASGVALLQGEKEWFELFENGEADATHEHH